MANYTPLRYPGGKGRFYSFIESIIEQNNLQTENYVEPFAGGAGIAFSMLANELVHTVHINDLNPLIYAFWHSVTKQTEHLCRLINDTPVDMENWHIQQLIKNNPEDHSLLRVGFATFFLNRTNRSGIINAGVIGGKEQNGKWKIDARFNKTDLINRIQNIASYGERVQIYNLDAATLLTEIVPNLSHKTFVYLDPPYYVKGKGLYQNHFSHGDHERISNLVAEIKQQWLVSYDNVPEISKLYGKYNFLDFDLKYSAHYHTQGSEIMFFKGGLKIPEPISIMRRA